MPVLFNGSIMQKPGIDCPMCGRRSLSRKEQEDHWRNDHHFGGGYTSTMNLGYGLAAHYLLNNNYRDSTSNVQHGTVGYNDSYLITQYKFNGNANDSKGTNHATAVGSVSYPAGKISQCIQFPNNSSVSLPNLDTYLDGSKDFTVTMWVKIPVCTLNYNILFFYAGTQTDGPFQGFRIDTDNTTKARFRYDTSLEQNKTTNGSTIADGNWHHIALSHKASTKTFQFFNDGVYIGSKVYTGTWTLIGGTGLVKKIMPYNMPVENTQVDDVRIYNYTFTLKNILDIYNLGNGVEYDSTTYPGLVTGKILNCSQFDGLGKYVQVNPFSLSSKNQTAFSWWYKFDEAPQNGCTNTFFSDQGQSKAALNGFFWIYASQNSITLNYADNQNNYGGNAIWTVTHNTSWHHAVMNIDWVNDTASLYIDGTLVLTKTLTANSSKNTILGLGYIFMGAYGTIYWHKLRGYMDDVRIYSRLLTTTEISFLYQSGNGNEG